MSKILISFLGTGNLNQDNTSARKYRTAKYRFGDNKEYESSFVAEAIYKHYDIDKIILIGTVKSMWEEVYESFCKLRGIEADSDYSTELWMHCADAGANSPLELPQKENIENALGPGSHIELIRYGLNKSEIDENESIILSIEKYLNKGDELYVDITHSFRSLPLFLMNLLIYIRNVSQKNIKISHISYGMIDVSRELGYAPVVELNSVITINDWITGAYAFSKFGNGYKIAELLENENTSASHVLNVFSDEMNLNHLHGVKVQTRRLASIKNTQFSSIPSSILPTAINDYVSRFSTEAKDGVFLLHVAEWHYERKKYSSSFISLMEAILTHVCDTLGLPSETSTDMEVAKIILGKKNTSHEYTIVDIDNMRRNIPHYGDLKECYINIKGIRNGLAHQKEIKINNQEVSSTKMIATLGEYIKKMKLIIK